MRRVFHIFLVACLLSANVSGVLAADSETLQFFEEEAQVITASRRSQAISDIPLAVDVITADEIRASGVVNIWDLLRFRVGMDVLDGRSVTGNRAVVSGRGFPHEFANNVLVLVDGRSVYSASDAGVYWEQLPVQIQDIERIEIVRGPNTALYGTGAGVGVIHIITKRPQGKNTLEADTRGGNRGMVQAYQAVDGSIFQKASVRISHTFQQQDGFPNASNTATVGNDSLHKNVLNIRAEIPISERSNLQLLSGGSRDTIDIGGTGTSSPVFFSNDFEIIKFSHKLSQDSTVEASSSRSDSIAEQQNSRQLQYDTEILHRLAWWDRHLNTTYGMNYRNVQATNPSSFGAFRPRLEIYRGYLQQTVKPIDEFSAQGAIAWEGSNIAGVHPDYQLAGIFAPVQGHAIRVSYSVAHTIRDFFPLYADLRQGSTRLLGNPQIAQPYKIISHEAGYYGNYLDKHLQTDASVFYTKIEGHHALVFQSFTFPPALTTLKFQITNDSIARGMEFKVKYRFTPLRWIYANYTLETISDKAGDKGFITDNTPTHKVNLGGSVDLAKGLSASANCGYKDKYFITSAAGAGPLAVRPYWRVDARLGYVLPRYKDAEIYIAGQNLLRPEHSEFPDGLAIPRTYSGGVSIKFGQ